MVDLQLAKVLSLPSLAILLLVSDHNVALPRCATGVCKCVCGIKQARLARLDLVVLHLRLMLFTQGNRALSRSMLTLTSIEISQAFNPFG